MREQPGPALIPWGFGGSRSPAAGTKSEHSAAEASRRYFLGGSQLAQHRRNRPARQQRGGDGDKDAKAAGARAHRLGRTLQGASALSVYGKDTHTLTALKSHPPVHLGGEIDYMGAHPSLASCDPPQAGPPGPTKTTPGLKQPAFQSIFLSLSV